MHAALVHYGEKAESFERDGFAAGVGAGDYEGVELAAELHVYGDRLALVEQRMARAAQFYDSVGNYCLAAVELVA